MRRHWRAQGTGARHCAARSSSVAAPTRLSQPAKQRRNADEHHGLAAEQALRFERCGWLLTQGLLPTEDVMQLRTELETVVNGPAMLSALQQRVRVLCPPGTRPPVSVAAAQKLLRQQGSDALGFLQFFNNWQSYSAVDRLIRSPEIAGTAAALLGVPRVRIFQDCVFLKEPGFAETNWHSDLRMTPLDTNSYVTAWIPLRPIGGGGSGAVAARKGRGKTGGAATTSSKKQRTPVAPEQMDDSGLLFAEGSHRDFALPFWHDLRAVDLSTRGYNIVGTGPMHLGDVSWHHGWTVHCAGPQPQGTPARMALAVSFFGDGARLLRRRAPSVHAHMLHDEDAESYGAWLDDLKDGAIARHDQLPLVYPPPQAHT